MDSSLSKIFNRLDSSFYPCEFSYADLIGMLSEREFSHLRKDDILRQNGYQTSVRCDACLDGHLAEVVIISTDEGYFICNRSMEPKTPINPLLYSQWQWNLPVFMKKIGKGLQLSVDPKPLSESDFWYLGIKTFNRMSVLVFYLRRIVETAKYQDFMIAQQTGSSVKNILILKSGDSSVPWLNIQPPPLFLSLEDLLKFEKSGIVFNLKQIKDVVTTGFRNIFFDERNGDVVLKSSTLGNITPSSPEYFFLSALWRSFDIPLTHQQIVTYMDEGLGEARDKNKKDDSQYCATIKSKIVSKLGEDVDKFLTATRTSGGLPAYRMFNPR